MNDVAKTPVPAEGKMPSVKLGITKAAITKLKKKYPADNVPDAGTKEGMLEIKGALRELVPLRTGVEKERSIQIAGAVAWQKKVNTEAKALKDAIAGIEEPYRDAKVAEEERIAKEKEAKRQAEEKRIAEIESKVADIQALAEGLLGADLPTLELRLDEVMQIKITDEEYMEFVEPASLVLGQVKQSLELAVSNGRQLAEQQEQMREQQEEFDRQQAELREQQDKLDQQKREQEEREEHDRLAKEKEAQDKVRVAREAEELKEQEEREAATAKELAARMPEDQKLRRYANSLVNTEKPEIGDTHLSEVLSTVFERLLEIQDYVFENTQDPAKVE